MEKEIIEKIIEVSEGEDWSVEIYENDFTFSIYSPCGQDFSFTITDISNLEDLLEKIQDRCDSFDCSYETYLWLDNTGHGTNGAPYDMKDLYEDMESCLEMMKDLKNQLDKLLKC